MIHDKYNPMQGIKKADPAPEIQERKSDGKPGLQSWQNSGPVVRLLEYLKKHEDKGMKLILKEGRACMRFEPGLSGKDRGTERWQIAVNTLQLLQEADEDLGYLRQSCTTDENMDWLTELDARGNPEADRAKQTRAEGDVHG